MTALWFLLRWLGILLFGFAGLGLSLAAIGATLHGYIRMDTAMTYFWAILAWSAVWHLSKDTRAAWREGAKPATVRSELRIVVVLLLLLGAAGLVVWPKVRELLDYGQEGANRGNLGALRAAIDAYTSARGKPPATLDDLVAHGFMPDIPLLRTRPHAKSKDVVALGDAPSDTGHWAYRVDASTDPARGVVLIDCTHTDMKASTWTSY